MNESDSNSLLILFGSQTGTAQDLAEKIGCESIKLGFKSRVRGFIDVNIHNLIKETKIIFILSTAGDGEFPDNSKMLWQQLLRKNLESNIFEKVKIAIFGLGDSNYDKFNWPSRKLSKRLSQLGAKVIIDKGEGDEQHPWGLEGTFFPWSLKLWENLCGKTIDSTIFHVKPSSSFILKVKNKYVEEKKNGNVALNMHEMRIEEESNFSSFENKAVKASVARNKRITDYNHWQDVRHIEIETSSILTYETGDVLCIRPKNAQSVVDKYMKILGWKSIANDFLLLQSNPSGLNRLLPEELMFSTLTLNTLFTEYLDLTMVPRR